LGPSGRSLDRESEAGGLVFGTGGEGKHEQNDGFFQIFCAKPKTTWVPEPSLEVRKTENAPEKTQKMNQAPNFLGPIELNGRSFSTRLKERQSRNAP
jgi:hypothetical protein